MIKGESLRKSFGTGRARIEVLRELTLEVKAGELTLVSGPSGCGKSTLLSILSGLLRTDAGRVIALGEDLAKLDERQIERFRLHHTGFVFQGFNLFPALTALEQVALPLSYLGFKKTGSSARAMAALEEVGLGPRAGLLPGALSGGEKQRVAIARAIAKEPALLFADEPTSSLDAASGQIVIDTLHRVARSHNTAVLCVSHDPRLHSHAECVFAMEDGRILSERRTTVPLEKTPP